MWGVWEKLENFRRNLMMYERVGKYMIPPNRIEWLQSLRAGSQVRCYVRTGKNGDGEIMRVHTCAATSELKAGTA
jgi:hypothetical protein